jgi:hypothetical protein
VALAENALERYFDADSRLIDIDTIPKSRRFSGHTRARWSAVIKCFACTIEEVDTSSISRT